MARKTTTRVVVREHIREAMGHLSKASHLIVRASSRDIYDYRTGSFKSARPRRTDEYVDNNIELLRLLEHDLRRAERAVASALALVLDRIDELEVP